MMSPAYGGHHGGCGGHGHGGGGGGGGVGFPGGWKSPREWTAVDYDRLGEILDEYNARRVGKGMPSYIGGMGAGGMNPWMIQAMQQQTWPGNGGGMNGGGGAGGGLDGGTGVEGYGMPARRRNMNAYDLDSMRFGGIPPDLDLMRNLMFGTPEEYSQKLYQEHLAKNYKEMLSNGMLGGMGGLGQIPGAGMFGGLQNPMAAFQGMQPGMGMYGGMPQQYAMPAMEAMQPPQRGGRGRRYDPDDPDDMLRYNNRRPRRDPFEGDGEYVKTRARVHLKAC